MRKHMSRVLGLLGAWLVVSLLIFTTACSKGGSGDSSQDRRRDTSKSKTAGKVKTKTDLKTEDRSKLPKPTGEGSEEQLERGSVDVVEGPKTVHYNPHGLTPAESDAANAALGAPVSGERASFEDEEGRDLFYSGSGQDRLREQLMGHLRSNSDKAQRKIDEEFAKTLSFGSFKVDWKTRRAEAGIVIDRNGRKFPISFSARLNDDLIIRSGGTDRNGEVELEAACMDLHGGCKTVFMTVRERSGDRIRTAYVLQRQTDAAIYASGNNFGISKNPEYDRFLRIIWNTEHDGARPNSLKFLRLITTEVINGKADFTVEMGMGTSERSQEVVAWNGPLVRPQSTNKMNLPIEFRFAKKSVIGGTIRDSRLIGNDSRGDLTIAVTFRKPNQQANEDTLQLRIGRMHTPVRDLELFSR